MPHKLIRFAGQVFNTPQLITEIGFRPIVNYLTERNYANLGRPIYQGEEGGGLATEELDIFNGIGVIQVSGAITYKPVEMLCAPESTSYLDLIEDTQEMIDAGVKAIIYEFDSCGGAAAHCWDTCDTLRQLLDESGVASYAYVDGCAHSAAYALACTFDEVIVHPSASTGSIGALIALIDDSKAMDMEGIKEVYVTSTPGKIPFDKDGSFKESFLAKLQKEVNKLGDEFVAHVSKYTGLSGDDIKAMDAQTFNAEDALQKGLVNSIMNHREFSNYISSKHK